MERAIEDRLDRAIDALERIGCALEKGGDIADRLAKLHFMSNRLMLQDLSERTPIFYPVYQSFEDALDALEEESRRRNTSPRSQEYRISRWRQ